MTVRTALLSVLVAGLLATPAFADEGATLTEAQELAFQGKLDQAIEAATRAFEADPSAPAGRLLQDLLGSAGRNEERAGVAKKATSDLVGRGLDARLLDPKPAIAALTTLLKTEGAPACFRLDLALAHLRSGRPAAAASVAERYTKEHPDSAEGHLVLAQTLAARKKSGPAQDAYERALQIQPGHPQASVGLAALLSDTKADAARDVLKNALKVYPDSADLRLGLAEDQIRRDELEDATQTLEGVLALPVPKGAVHTRLAEVWRLRQDYVKAASSATAALADKSMRSETRARAYRTLGFTKQKRDDLKGARADYELALENAPQWAQLHADIGFMFTLSDELESAVRCLEYALKLDKDLLDAHLKYGVALFLSDKAKKAKKEFGIVLKGDKDNVAANRYLGYVLLDEGKPKTALKHFQRVADQRPKDASSMRMVGRCHLAMGKVDEALDAFQLAVSRDAKDGFAQFDLGKAYEKKADWDKAEAAYRKAIELDGKLTHPNLYLAELLDFVQGKPEDAIPLYERYLALGGPDDSDVIQKRIEQLKKK